MESASHEEMGKVNFISALEARWQENDEVEDENLQLGLIRNAILEHRRRINFNYFGISSQPHSKMFVLV